MVYRLDEIESKSWQWRRWKGTFKERKVDFLCVPFLQEPNQCGKGELEATNFIVTNGCS